MRSFLVLSSTIALFTAGCSAGGGLTNGVPATTLSNGSVPSVSEAPAKRPATTAAPHGGVRSVVVYTLSNNTTHNRVLAFIPGPHGLRYDQSFDTRGLGEPSIAGTVQGAIATSGDGRFLFAVDAGSNEITSFRVENDELHFISKVASRGMEPVSLAVHDGILFALNEASSSIAGFRITRNGILRAIPNSNAPLSGSNVGPAEISFDHTGGVLVVTEKGTNSIDTYSVSNGVPTGPTVHASSGTTPFGFAFVPHSETIVVSEASGGASQAGTASSYGVSPPDTLTPISKSVPDQNTAPCWVAITNSGVAFTSNTASGTISAYAISAMGNLTLTTQNGISATTGQSPTDLALSPGDRYLFVVNLKSRSIGAYAVGSGGTLTQAGGVKQLPVSALGLAALPYKSI